MSCNIPALKKIGYIPAASLSFETDSIISPKSVITVYSEFTDLPIVRYGGLTVTPKMVNGEEISTTVVKFSMEYDSLNDYGSELMRVPSSFRVTDIRGVNYILGLKDKPHPMVMIGSVVDDVPSGKRIRNVEITFTAAYSVLRIG